MVTIAMAMEDALGALTGRDHTDADHPTDAKKYQMWRFLLEDQPSPPPESTI